MDEQPLDRERIRREERAYGGPTGESALLDLLEQTERHLAEGGRAAAANFALLIQQRDKSREALKGSEQSRLLGEQRLAEVMAERDVVRRERDDQEIAKRGAIFNCEALAEQIARLAEERDAYQTALKRLAGLLDPKVPPAPEPYLRQIVDDALAAVPVVPDPNDRCAVCKNIRSFCTCESFHERVVPVVPDTYITIVHGRSVGGGGGSAADLDVREDRENEDRRRRQEMAGD